MSDDKIRRLLARAVAALELTMQVRLFNSHGICTCDSCTALRLAQESAEIVLAEYARDNVDAGNCGGNILICDY